MTNLDSILKSRDITLPTKVCLIRAVVLPVVMYGCESWTIKKTQGQRIDAFELWCWRRLLRLPWIAKRSDQSILNEISPEYSLEGLMLKLKLQYFGHLIWRADSFEKTLMLGMIEGRRRWGRQTVRWLDGITNSTDMSLSKKSLEVGDGQGGLECCSPWGCKQSDTTEWLNWTELWGGHMVYLREIKLRVFIAKLKLSTKVHISVYGSVHSFLSLILCYECEDLVKNETNGDTKWHI